MPIRVKCDACKKTLSVKDHLAGKKIKCPLCQAIVTVPAAGPVKEKAAEPKPEPVAKKPVAGIPAPVPGGAKQTKPAVKPKTVPGKPTTNGTPPASAKSSAAPAAPPAKPPEPESLPPEDLENEALSAWADEPPPPEAEAVTPEIALAPVVGWTAEGFRLGYGGGYFDRTLAELRPRPFAVGVGFELSRLDSIRPEGHDQRLDAVVTEVGVFWPSA